VRILGLEISAERGDTSSDARLIEYAGVSYDFMTRVNALSALRKLGRCGSRLFPALFSAMANPNGRLRGPAQSFASYFMEQASVARSLRDYYRSRAWTQMERAYLDPYFK
jgi:hypothetical protein